MNGFWIIGDDGGEYGPVSEDEIRNWISDRRVDAETRVRQGNDGSWKRAAEYPEFAAALIASAPALGPGRATEERTPPASGYATASLICGLLTLPTSCCCPVAAIPGVVCGIVALRKIAAAPDRHGGRKSAVWGIALSVIGVMVFVGLHLAGVALDGFLEGWGLGN